MLFLRIPLSLIVYVLEIELDHSSVFSLFLHMDSERLRVPETSKACLACLYIAVCAGEPHISYFYIQLRLASWFGELYESIGALSIRKMRLTGEAFRAE